MFFITLSTTSGKCQVFYEVSQRFQKHKASLGWCRIEVCLEACTAPGLIGAFGPLQLQCALKTHGFIKISQFLLFFRTLVLKI